MSERGKTYQSDVEAGCFVCHGDKSHWTASNALALAARHHTATGHPTWCSRILVTRYGAQMVNGGGVNSSASLTSCE